MSAYVYAYVDVHGGPIGVQVQVYGHVDVHGDRFTCPPCTGTSTYSCTAHVHD